VTKETRSKQLQRYSKLQDAAWDLVNTGRFRRALEVLDEALEVARSVGPLELIDRAWVNRARMAVELGPEDKALVQELGHILLRSRDSETGFRAALHLTRAYQLRKEHGRSLFYGRIACERAAQTGSSIFAAMARNELGLCLLASSYFGEAASEFEAALELIPREREPQRAAILDNLGYCYVVLGRSKEGFRRLYEALRTVRGLNAGWLEMNIRISLSFGLLEVRKPSAALRHGREALEIADGCDDASAMKSALFLLGEAAKQAGEELLARRYFSRLQETFYSDAPYLADMLMMIDARTLVNLKA
jgi:tetratricopeptide (TPR) repeat protein